jgi:hypothetical protein
MMIDDADTSFRPGGMIGMLDYRANKLHRLLALPLTLIAYAASIVLVVGSFLITQNWSGGYILSHLILAWLAFEVSGVIWALLWGGLVVTLFNKLFFYLIDVVPGEGRTYEQARAVVFGGDRARLLLKMDDVENWTDSDTREFVKRVPMISRIFFADKIRARLNECIALVQKTRREGKPLKQGWEVIELCGPILAKKSWQEKMATKLTFRTVFPYLLMLACFVIYYG